jgi:hypothetical protein
MLEPHLPRSHPHRWLQFRLRSLLAVMLLAAITAGMTARYRAHRDYLRRQQAALDLLKSRIGLTVTPEATELIVPWGFDEDELRYLAYLPRLQRLSISGTEFRDRGTRHLARLNHLRELEIYAVSLSDDALEDLTELPRLERLHLSAQISREGVLLVSRMTQLQALALNLPPDADTGPLRQLQELESLRLMAGNTLRDGDLEFLADMPRLQAFWLQCSIEGDVLSALRHVPQLTELRLQANQLGNLDLEFIRGHIQLRHLTLESNSGNDINDEGLRYLERMADLRYLNLSHCRRLTDDGLARLDRLHKLQTLRLRWTGVTDRGLPRLARLAQLERLYLHSTNVTPAGLQPLAAFPRLQYLELPAPWDQETVATVQKQLPNVTLDQ